MRRLQSGLLLDAIRDSPEIGFVPSNYRPAGVQPQNGFVPSVEIAPVQGGPLAEAIRDSPEIGFVFSKRPAISNQLASGGPD